MHTREFHSVCGGEDLGADEECYSISSSSSVFLFCALVVAVYTKALLASSGGVCLCTLRYTTAQCICGTTVHCVCVCTIHIYVSIIDLCVCTLHVLVHYRYKVAISYNRKYDINKIVRVHVNVETYKTLKCSGRRFSEFHLR